MSEMIDRLARALYESQKFKRPWDHDITQRIWRKPMVRYARAAIEVMRDPSPEMMLVLSNAISDDLSTDEAWKAAIDAALR